MITTGHATKVICAAVLILLAQMASAAPSDSSGAGPTSKYESTPADAMAAAKEKELKQLQTILATLNQELESTYHQFQMLQEARKDVVQSLTTPRSGLDPRSYDEMVNERNRAMNQEKALSDQMNQLLEKAQTIQSKMSPILDRIYQLIPDSGSYQQNQAAENPANTFTQFESKPVP